MRDEFTLTEINRQQTGLGLPFLNIPTLVRENSDCWTTIESENGLKLQRNNITGHGCMPDGSDAEDYWENW